MVLQGLLMLKRAWNVMKINEKKTIYLDISNTDIIIVYVLVKLSTFTYFDYSSFWFVHT